MSSYDESFKQKKGNNSILLLRNQIITHCFSIKLSMTSVSLAATLVSNSIILSTQTMNVSSFVSEFLYSLPIKAHIFSTDGKFELQLK